jgi:hypothetical protein
VKSFPYSGRCRGADSHCLIRCSELEIRGIIVEFDVSVPDA